MKEDKVERIFRYFKNMLRNKKVILITGYPKSGNHWVRFFICNYYGIKNMGIEEPFTLQEMNYIIAPNRFEDLTFIQHPDLIPTIIRSHAKFDKFFSLADCVVYIWRNPLDTLISWWYNSKQFNPPFNKWGKELATKFIDDIDYFVDYNMPDWIEHIETTKDKADVVLNYDKLRKNPKLFALIPLEFDGEYDKEIVDKAIEFSSFNTVKKITDHKYTVINKSQQLIDGILCRKGTVGQWKYELKPETIKKWKKYGKY